MSRLQTLQDTESLNDEVRDSEVSSNNDGAAAPAATRASLRIRSRGMRKRCSGEMEGAEAPESGPKPFQTAMIKSEPEDPPKQPTERKRKAPSSVESKASKEPRCERKTAEVAKKDLNKPQEMFYEFTNIDVLFGRGNHVNKLAGNLRFRRKVHPFREAYNATKDASQKREILLEAYNSVREGGARFMDILEWVHNAERNNNEGIFRTATRARALEKVAQALREPKWTPPPLEDSASISNGSKETVMDSETETRKKSLQDGKTETKVLFRALRKQNKDSGTKAMNQSPQDGKTGTVVKSIRKQNEDSGTKATKECLQDENTETVVKPPLKQNKDTSTKSMKKSSQPASKEDQPTNLIIGQKEEKTSQFKHVLLFNAEGHNEEEVIDTEKSLVEEEEMSKPEETQGMELVKSDKKKNKNPSPSSGASKKPPRKRSYHVDNDDAPGEVLGLDELGAKDVLFGRGHHINANPGNVEFRRVIKQNKPAYARLPLTSKRPMAIEIYHQFGGRFLEAASGANLSGANANGARLLFRKVKLERCIEKICQALREKYAYVIPEHEDGKTLSKTNGDISEDNAEDGKSKGNRIRPRPPSKGGSGEGAKTSKESRELEDKTSCAKKSRILGIGSRIAVYWPIDEVFYEAVVEKLSCMDGLLCPDIVRERKETKNGIMYFIRYALDSQCEWIDLTEHQYTVLAAAAAVPEKLESGEVVRIMRSGHVKRHIARRTLFWQETKAACITGGMTPVNN